MYVGISEFFSFKDRSKFNVCRTRAIVSDNTGKWLIAIKNEKDSLGSVGCWQHGISPHWILKNILPILILSGLNNKLHLFSLEGLTHSQKIHNEDFSSLLLYTFYKYYRTYGLKGLFQPKWFYNSAKFPFTWILHKSRASPASLESLITDLKIVLLQKFRHSHKYLTAMEATHCPYAIEDTFSKKDMSCWVSEGTDTINK